MNPLYVGGATYETHSKEKLSRAGGDISPVGTRGHLLDRRHCVICDITILHSWFLPVWESMRKIASPLSANTWRVEKPTLATLPTVSVERFG